MNGAKFLITGAAGFIGSALSKSIKIDGGTVLAIDSISDYYAVDLKERRIQNFIIKQEIEFVKADVANFSQINSIVSEFKPDTIIHLAAQAGVRIPIERTSDYVNSNLLGHSNLLTSAVLNNIPNFLYASSSSVYGEQSSIPYNEKELNLVPSSFYGATKRSNEITTPTLVSNSNTKARGLRFFTVYGPWGRPDMAYFRMIANALVGSKFNFNGDGNIERDFTYIGDAIHSVKLLSKELAERQNGFSDIVNVGGGNPLSMNQLMRTIQNITGKKIVFDRKPNNPGDISKTMADASYIESLIKFSPNTSLNDGIERSVEWADLEVNKRQLEMWVKSVL